MTYPVLKVHAPRPTFLQDMTPAERELMARHGEYLRSWMDRGKILLFGPVAGPEGVYGLAIARPDEEETPAEIVSNDPVILADAGFRYQVGRMLAAVSAVDPG